MAKRIRNPRKVIVLGMFLLVLANMSRYLPRVVSVSADRLDFVMGLFYGLAIGTMLAGLALQKKMRQQM